MKLESSNKTLAALIDACREDAKAALLPERNSNLWADIASKGDDKLSLRYFGVSASNVGNRLGISRSACIRRLHTLQRHGFVISEARAGGWTWWWPLGLASELQKESHDARQGGDDS